MYTLIYVPQPDNDDIISNATCGEERDTKCSNQICEYVTEEEATSEKPTHNTCIVFVNQCTYKVCMHIQMHVHVKYMHVHVCVHCLC